MTLSTPLAVPAAASPARRDRVRVAARWLDLVLPLGLVLAAFGLRLPYLWTVPRFSDETREALLAIEILHGNDAGLVNVDAYIGGFYNWLLAVLFWLTGVSAYTPRLVTAVAGALAVGFTYLLARDLGGRVAAIVAAALLATSGSVILSNGHLGWSHCLTPTFTTLAAWLLQRGDPLTGHRTRAARERARVWRGLSDPSGHARAVARRGPLCPLVGPALAADTLAVPGAGALPGRLRERGGL